MTPTQMLRLLAAGAWAGAIASAPVANAAASPQTRDFRIPAGTLDRALIAFADQSGRQVLFAHAQVAGRTVPALSGRFAADALLARLLANTGLVVDSPRPGVMVIKPAARSTTPGRADAAPAGVVATKLSATASPDGIGAAQPFPEPKSAPVPEVDAVVVTGSLIRGAAQGASPVITISREAMDRAGQASVAEALQALPQTFGGTSTPQTSLIGSDGLGTNTARATGVNLRGLGANSTLVLVNGRRMARMGLWLNPLVDAATSASDFDLRTLRSRMITLYLAASPDNLPRVAPLYNLLFQQLVDVSTRRRPSSDQTGQVLLVLDEFARLGHASMLAHGFSFVAGYGLRILAVLQSPSQLRAEYGPDLAEEIIANCGVEIAFTPKELSVAKALSERLGDYTYAGRSRSAPLGLSSGRRSKTESDQRRPLLLPQELLQMPKSTLLVLRGGIAPVRGRKLVYHGDRAFTRRLLPPPPTPRIDDTESQGRRIQAIALEVASLRDTVEDIRTRVIERPMTIAEMAGETPIDPQSIALTLQHVDMDALAPDAPDPTVRHFMRDYLDRVAAPPDIGGATPHQPPARTSV